MARVRRVGSSRPTVWVLSVLAAVVPSGRATLLAADEPSPEALPLALVDFADLPFVSVAVLQAETRAILAPQGRELRWRRWTPRTDLEAREVPVVLLAGAHPVPRRDGVVLGSVLSRAVRPTVWVYVRAVRRAVGLTRSPATTDTAAQRALGVALGRVVAHELVHAVAPWTRHTTLGLMAPAYDHESLVGVRPRLDPATAAAYRAALESWPVPEAAGVARVGPQPLTERSADQRRPDSWSCAYSPWPRRVTAKPGP